MRSRGAVVDLTVDELGDTDPRSGVTEALLRDVEDTERGDR